MKKNFFFISLKFHAINFDLNRTFINNSTLDESFDLLQSSVSHLNAHNLK
jgi:hypothetical protein